MKISAGMVLVVAGLVLASTAGCAPMMEFRNGPDEQRLRRIALQFCDALRSADRQAPQAMFIGPVRTKLRAVAESGRSVPYTSGDPQAACGAGRAWYLGGSRMFAEVRTTSGSDRLDVWRGEWMRDREMISDVIYGRPILVNGRPVKTLEEALDALAPPRAGQAADGA